jgi:hypothetical protein
MSTRQAKNSREEAQEKGEIDREVQDVIQAERRRGSRRGPKDAAAEQKKQRLAEAGLRAIKAKDARTFTELLRQAGVRENSPEWKNAWKVFYES